MELLFLPHPAAADSYQMHVNLRMASKSIDTMSEWMTDDTGCLFNRDKNDNESRFGLALDQRSCSTLGPVNTGMDYHLHVNHLHVQPAT